jgi:hypothetical protein
MYFKIAGNMLYFHKEKTRKAGVVYESGYPLEAKIF